MLVSSRFRANSPIVRSCWHATLPIFDPTQQTPTSESCNASSASWSNYSRYPRLVLVVALFFVVAVVHLQTPASELVNLPGQRPPAASEKTEASDPLGRNTPNGT